MGKTPVRPPAAVPAQKRQPSGALAPREARQRDRARAAKADGGVWARWRVIGLGVALAIAVLAVAFWAVSTATEATPADGPRFMPGQGRDHVPPGQAHPAYNSQPPTSGWHYDTPAPWGVHDSPLADEATVHNLEHGGIVIQYWCPDGCADQLAKLRALVGRYPSKVLLAPYARPLPNRIALTAWHWIDTFDTYDEPRIVDFINEHKNQGPEKVPD